MTAEQRIRIVERLARRLKIARDRRDLAAVAILETRLGRVAADLVPVAA